MVFRCIGYEVDVKEATKMTAPNSSNYWSLIQTLLGQKIVRIDLIEYEYQGLVDSSDKMVQLTFENGESIYFAPDRDGEGLRSFVQPWEDPFAGSLSSEDKAFIEKSGKWTLKNVSSRKPFLFFIGQNIKSITPIRKEEKLVGIVIRVEKYFLSVTIDGDESAVTIGKENTV